LADMRGLLVTAIDALIMPQTLTTFLSKFRAAGSVSA
jgi:hypothetical protein